MSRPLTRKAYERYRGKIERCQAKTRGPPVNCCGKARADSTWQSRGKLSVSQNKSASSSSRHVQSSGQFVLSMILNQSTTARRPAARRGQCRQFACVPVSLNTRFSGKAFWTQLRGWPPPLKFGRAQRRQTKLKPLVFPQKQDETSNSKLASSSPQHLVRMSSSPGSCRSYLRPRCSSK